MARRSLYLSKCHSVRNHKSLVVAQLKVWSLENLVDECLPYITYPDWILSSFYVQYWSIVEVL